MIKASMVAGELFEVEFEVTVSGIAEDITDYTAKIELRDVSPEGKIISEWADGSPEITRANDAGKVVLRVPGEVTNGYKFKTAFMDLLLQKSPEGRRSAAIQITLIKGVTR